MKAKVVLSALLACGLILGLAPARAASECGLRFAGVPAPVAPPGTGLAGGAGTAGQSCTFTAGSAVHGYVSTPALPFMIFLDPNNNQRRDSSEQILAQSQGGAGAPSAGPLTIPAGALVTVQIPASDGYAGLVLVG